MGITERREREKREVRERILDAARELFARDGYEAVTMRKVADAIEYSGGMGLSDEKLQPPRPGARRAEPALLVGH